MAETLNMDIASLVRYLDRYILEMIGSTSSGTTDVRKADKTRLNAYIDGLVKRKEVVAGEDELDCPKTNRVSYVIPELPAVPPMDNDIVLDIINQLIMIRQELAEAPAPLPGPLPLDLRCVRRMTPRRLAQHLDQRRGQVLAAL